MTHTTITLNRRDVNWGGSTYKAAWLFTASTPVQRGEGPEPHTGWPGGQTYQLQVRHDAIETAFRFVRFDCGDEVQLLDAAEWRQRLYDIATNEPSDCCAECAPLTDEQRWEKYDAAPMDDEGFACAGCKAVAYAQAERWLVQRDDVAQATAEELALRDEMLLQWHALTIVFDPAYTV